MDAVFDALAHPVRRELLDRLREQDGQSLHALEAGLTMTRFGVMKHLKVLEEAGLVVTRKAGREKLHYLNPVPLQQVSDRWISRYAAPFVRTMVDLKDQLEGKTPAMSAVSAPRHVYELLIGASAQAVWDIITDDSKTPLYQHFDMTSRTDWRVGGAITFFFGETPMIVGEILAFEPPQRLTMSFSARWAPDVAADAPSRVTWEITALDNALCKLVLVHDGFAGDTATAKAVTGGWPETLSRLKTLAETGRPLRVPPPQRAAG